MPKLDFTKQLFKNDVVETEDIIPTEFDVTPFIERFESHENRIKLMADEVKGFVVENDDDNERATAMGSTASKANKELEELRKQIVKPHNDFVRKVNNCSKMYTGKIKEQIIDPLKAKITTYAAKKELEIRKKQEEERKAAEKLQKDLNMKAKKAGVEAPQVDIPAVKPRPAGPVKTTPGTGFQQKRWTYDVTDITKVPREFLVLDRGKVMKAINAGKRDIPGLDIHQKSSTAFRTG